MQRNIFGLIVLTGLLAGSAAMSQVARSPVKVVVKDGKTVVEEATVPVDPTPRLAIGHSQGNGFIFGLSVEGKRICCSPDGSIWINGRIDGREVAIGQGQGAPMPVPLAAGPFNRKRQGKMWTWSHENLVFTQIVELVPSKPASSKVQPGQKRLLDTARISYVVENKGDRTRKIELRQGIDILIVNNDGALFASPTTHKDQVLNGVLLKDKQLPDYLYVLEKPNVNDPGFKATMTFKLGGKASTPDRVVLTRLGTFNGWDLVPQQAGDSACAIYWPPHDLKAGTKHEFAWAYGGGHASSPENDGVVSLALGGSFEPNKAFTLTAYVEYPLANQTLTLELPTGLERLEGSEVQTVPPPSPSTGTSVVMWKGRVLRPGDYEIKVRSSSGVTQSKHISITPG